MNVSWVFTLIHRLPCAAGGIEGTCRRISWDSAILFTPTPTSSAGFGCQDGMRKGREEKLEEEEEEGEEAEKGKRSGGGGVTELETILSRSCRLPCLHPLNRGSVPVVELNQVDLGNQNQVHEEEEGGRMRKVAEGHREVGRRGSRTYKIEVEKRTDEGNGGEANQRAQW